MRASIAKKALIIAIFFLLLLLLAGNAGSSEVEPIYAGWAVGVSWNGYGMILRSTDSGKTWIRQGAGQIADVTLGGVFAIDPYTAWAVGDQDSGYATIYHTTDGGITWGRKGASDMASDDYIPDVALGKVHVVGNDVWAVGIDAILHTGDGGSTWTNQYPAWCEKGNQLQGVYALDSNTVWVTGGPDHAQHAVILKTTDAGLTWTRQMGGDVPDAKYLIGISVADADTAWAVGHPYIALKTTDGGEIWTREPEPPFGGVGDVNEVYAVSTSIVWIAADNSILWTTDGGQSWGDSSDHGLSGAMAYNGISAVGAQKAWTSYYNAKENSGYIAYTTDGGTTWTKVEQLDGEDLPGFQNISFATQPINPDYLIISLIVDVEMLVDDGSLNKRQGNSLIKKLEHALDWLADDRPKRAIIALGAFSKQVDAFVRRGFLTPDIGQDLSDKVNYIIELISFPL